MIFLLPIDFFTTTPIPSETIFIKRVTFYGIFYEIKAIFVKLLTSQPSI